MLDIIRVQLFRLKKSVLFWVMFGITAALPVLGSLMIVSLVGAVDGTAGAIGGENLGLSFGDLLRNAGLTVQLLNSLPQLGSNVAVLSVITSSIVLSKEFNDGTIRNVLLANKTRAELYFGYLITSIIVSLGFLISNFATTLLVAAPIFGFGDLTAGGAVTACLCSFALGIVAVLFMQTCMCMFLFSMRKQWAAILFPLLICIFVPVIFGTIATLIITTMMLKGANVNLDALRWVPFYGISLYDSNHIDGVTAGMNVLYMAVFIAMFVVIGYFTFRKADLK